MNITGESIPVVSQPLQGLTTAAAAERLHRIGPNAMVEEQAHPWRTLLAKLWAPVPWMLELAILLELLLGKTIEAGVVTVLLLFNAVLSFLQESRAQNALALLRQRLAILARVLRDGRWQKVSAQELVPDDVIYLRMGDVVPADVRLLSGQIQLDQSALTGESIPVEACAGTVAPAGAVVTRGEATGTVTATGTHTIFGKTAELVRLARTGSQLQMVIFRIVKYLVILDALLAAAVLAYAMITGISLKEILPFALILLIASVPVALPATFTVATALGALELAKRGVLVTRLSAIEEAAGMTVLCTDKTGTITKNQLAVASVRAYAPNSDDELLRLAALACDESTQDPLDLAVLDMARARGVLSSVPRRVQFVPFDPATKRSEAFFQLENTTLHVVKGAPEAIAASITPNLATLADDVSLLASDGSRVLAVAAGEGADLSIVGLIGLRDPPREDSKDLVQSLRELGVRVVMVTGDSLATANAVARQVGIGARLCTPKDLRNGRLSQIVDCDVFAGVLPDDKFHLVKTLQRRGNPVGMTGDGVNDAPALRQAEVGIAVANATDVAKAAASLVLTQPGLGNVVGAVETSRRIHQRMLTYTLNKIIKTCEIALFLSLGLVFTGTFVTTPLLIVLLLFTNDFVTMSIATDRVDFARLPTRWQIGPLVGAGLTLAALILCLFFGIVLWAKFQLHLSLPQIQSLVFIMLVFAGQGTVYLVRERGYFWHSRPSRWLLVSSAADLLIVSLMATNGVLMAAISPVLVVETLVLIILYLAAVDLLKVRVFEYFGLADSLRTELH